MELWLLLIILCGYLFAVLAGVAMGFFLGRMTAETQHLITSDTPPAAPGGITSWQYKGKEYMSDNLQVPTLSKERPTQSAVLKNPTPEEVRKMREQEIEQDFLEHQKTIVRDSGTFAQ